jgi:hypothetical protein
MKTIKRAEIPMKLYGGCYRFTLSLILFCFLTFTLSEGKMNASSSIINPTLYADYQASSYLAGKPSITGTVKWKHDSANSDLPIHLSIVGNLLLTCNQQSIQAYDCHTGNIVWDEPVRKDFDYICTHEGVLVNKYYRLRDYTKKEYYSFLITTYELSYLTIFQKIGSRIIYAFRTIYEPQGRGEAPWKPQYTMMRYEDEERQSYFMLQDAVISNLLTKDDQIMVLLTKNKSYLIHPLGDMTNEKVTPVICTNILSGSLAPSGDLLLVEKLDTGYFLECSQLDGKQKWKVEIPDISRGNQPPASTPSGSILYVAGESLLCIDAGKIRWSAEISGVPLASYITAFGASSALVASGPRLVLINDSGKEVLAKTLFFVPSCRPIFGPDGAVYVAGEGGICCIK